MHYPSQWLGKLVQDMDVGVTRDDGELVDSWTNSARVEDLAV